MNPTLLNLLQSKSTLKIAADWVNDNPNDPFVQNNPILHYTLLFLIKHDKYPMIVERVTKTTPELSEIHKYEILKSVAAESTTNTRNINEKFKQAKKEFRKQNNLQTIITSVPKLHLRISSPAIKEHEIPANWADDEIYADTWEHLLEKLMNHLAPYYEIYQISH